jgi:Ca2+-binding EF-hand superfamily protein
LAALDNADWTMTQREPKKNESIEVRVSHEIKVAFMAACAAKGVSASTVLRRHIARYVAAANRAPHHWMEELSMLFDSLMNRPIVAGACGAVLAGIATASLAVPAYAAIDPRVATVFEWMDTNHDGILDQAEFIGTPQSAGPAGAIGIEMTSKTPPPPGETRARLFRRLDTDRNGVLTMRELAAGASITTVVSPAVAAADANKDGRISEAELAAYLTSRRASAGAADPSAGVGLMVHGIIAASHPDANDTVSLAD